MFSNNKYKERSRSLRQRRRLSTNPDTNTESSPTPTPTPTPVPTPPDPADIQIEVSNNRPVITLVPGINGHYRIVFSANAPHLDSLTASILVAYCVDGNQEIWIYELPIVNDVDLTTGADLPVQDLTLGTFTKITNTPASRVPSPGGTGIFPFVADDNRDATISETGEIIAFISRNLATNNADGNPELFLHTISNPGVSYRARRRQIVLWGLCSFCVSNSPSISADGSVVAFISMEITSGNNNDDGNGHGNAELYIGSFSGGVFTVTRQATRTKSDTSGPAFGATVNVLSPSQRLSRDGTLVAFESLLTSLERMLRQSGFLAVFVYTITQDRFDLVGKQAIGFPGDVIHFPTFNDYNGSLTPATLIYASALNSKLMAHSRRQQKQHRFRSRRQVRFFDCAADTATAIQTANEEFQVFAAFSPLTTATSERMVFSAGGAELGGGNADGSTEEVFTC